MIDGDDTLWENNIYFEAALERFIDFLDHSRLSRGQVREAVAQVEKLNIARHGYGSNAFARNLEEAYAALRERDVREDDSRALLAFAGEITDHDLEILPGVESTLADLSLRNELTLFTKGDLAEQQLKVDRSGLARFFKQVVISPEKDVNAYLDLVARHGLDAERTWMVGNSPRSDINPAIQAGLGAVFVPHQRTWSLELDELASAPRLIVLEKFEELSLHF